MSTLKPLILALSACSSSCLYLASTCQIHPPSTSCHQPWHFQEKTSATPNFPRHFLVIHTKNKDLEPRTRKQKAKSEKALPLIAARRVKLYSSLAYPKVPLYFRRRVLILSPLSRVLANPWNDNSNPPKESYTRAIG